MYIIYFKNSGHKLTDPFRVRLGSLPWGYSQILVDVYWYYYGVLVIITVE